MHIDDHFGSSERNIAICVLITSAIGIYLLANTCIIPEDGVTFIRYAQNLMHTPRTIVLEEDQHPGFPALILAVKTTASLFSNAISTKTWIYSGQLAALLSRILTVIVFYFVALYLLKDRTFSFFATLIIVFLPEPAQMGSNVLSEWPHLFWLLAAYGLILLASKTRKPLLFAMAGLCSGIGYLIRPEAAQVVLIGLAWLTIAFIRPAGLSRIKIVSAAALLVAGFIIAAGPYMHLKNAVFPKKQVLKFSVVNENISPKPEHCDRVFFKPEQYCTASLQFVAEIAETYSYYFLPPALIGHAIWRRRTASANPSGFIISSALLLNFALMVWLYCEHHYMSLRHTLPAAMILAIFIPTGAHWIAVRLFKNHPSELSTGFAIIIILIGLVICSFELFRPDYDKALYIDAAEWIKKNTPADATISCQDSRIAFYADRACSENGDYIVEKTGIGASINGRPVTAFSSQRFGYQIVIFKAK